MPNERFPDYSTNPTPVWVNGLSAHDKEEYERVRVMDIEKDAERITAAFRSVSDFDEISDEAIGYMALRFATPMRDCYEEGIQVGMEAESRRFQAERARHHSIEIARLGGWG